MSRKRRGGSKQETGGGSEGGGTSDLGVGEEITLARVSLNVFHESVHIDDLTLAQQQP